jgi:hypothetical protein
MPRTACPAGLEAAAVRAAGGIGEEAFYPNDQGPRELVVRSGGVIFAVTVFVFLAEPPPSAIEDVASLATAIVADL